MHSKVDMLSLAQHRQDVVISALSDSIRSMRKISQQKVYLAVKQL